MPATTPRPSTQIARAPARPPWRRPWVMALVYQGVALVIVVVLVLSVVANVREYLPRVGLAIGWDFLRFPARFEINDNIVGATARDPVWMAFLAGAANTVLVSITSIVLCILLALPLALARMSPNWLLSRTALLYIETVRNIPLLLQLLFWYGLSTVFPLPRDAWQPIVGVFVTDRGVFHPALVMTPVHYVALGVFALVVAISIGAMVFTRRRRAAEHSNRLLWYTTALLIVLPTLVLLLGGAGFTFTTPQLRGFNFVGGGTITPEFVALAVGLAVYQSGFTAETIRSGILGVQRGQIEAARSLGLKPSHTLRLVILPQALRIVIPPMTSQFLSLTKSSSLGVVIGYPELMRVTTAVISETGQAIECIAIIMAIYLALSLLTSLLMSEYARRTAYVER